MKRARFIVIVLGVTLAAWITLTGAIGIVAIEGATHLPRAPITVDSSIRVRGLAEQNHAILSDVAIEAKDGVSLRAWSIRPLPGNGNAVILMHGQGDNRAGMLGPALMLLRHGYSVLLPDARAHGLSGGAIGTYGLLEADDIHRWFDWLEKNESPHCIDGLGDSMGAAELLESLTVESHFCAVIAESPFATFREAAYDRLGQQFSTGTWLGRTLLRPAFVTAAEYARLRYGIDFSHADPSEAVASSRVPILLIHGLADTNLPPRHSQMIKARNPSVTLWEPAVAGHCGASTAEPVEYEQHVIDWFAVHNFTQNIARTLP
jgi:pimeloyl-ACP methyl ester carboxylesterase